MNELNNIIQQGLQAGVVVLPLKEDQISSCESLLQKYSACYRVLSLDTEAFVVYSKNNKLLVNTVWGVLNTYKSHKLGIECPYITTGMGLEDLVFLLKKLKQFLLDIEAEIKQVSKDSFSVKFYCI